jgi:hypothetical protein
MSDQMSENQQKRKVAEIIRNTPCIYYQHVQKNNTMGEKKRVYIKHNSELKYEVYSWKNILWGRYKNWTEDSPTIERIDYIEIERHDNELWLPLGNHVVNVKNFIQAYEQAGGVYTERKFHCGPAGTKIKTLGYFTFS